VWDVDGPVYFPDDEAIGRATACRVGRRGGGHRAPDGLWCGRAAARRPADRRDGDGTGCPDHPVDHSGGNGPDRPGADKVRELVGPVA
jgi:hypothetical protein